MSFVNTVFKGSSSLKKKPKRLKYVDQIFEIDGINFNGRKPLSGNCFFQKLKVLTFLIIWKIQAQGITKPILSYFKWKPNGSQIMTNKMPMEMIWLNSSLENHSRFLCLPKVIKMNKSLNKYNFTKFTLLYPFMEIFKQIQSQ